MTETILVGATGWFGAQIRTSIAQIIPVSAQDVLDSRGDAIRALLAGTDRVVVNAAGSRKGDAITMQKLNVELPRILAEQVSSAGSYLVHLGSASEYGTGNPGSLFDESCPAAGESAYGKSKAAGTELVLEIGSSTVLRIFNVAGSPPQDGSPLADIVQRISAACATGADVELLSANTVRDWVRPEFVCASILHAIKERPTGLFNICSGVGVRMGDAAQLALAQLGSTAHVKDLDAVPANVVIGAPDRWRSVSQMSDQVTPAGLASLMSRSARRPESESVEGDI